MSRLLGAVCACICIVSFEAFAAPAQERVVTIYFAGTTMDSSMWDPNTSPFARAETIATLFLNQEESGNQHKFIVNGIGSGGLLDLNAIWGINPSASDLLGQRGWNGVTIEAIANLDNIVTTFPDANDDNIILNLVGFSRGAVSTMHLANKISTEPAYVYIKDRIKRINILTFDPVPGDEFMQADIFELPSIVNEYLGFYSNDERTIVFSPSSPAQQLARVSISSRCLAVTKQWWGTHIKMAIGQIFSCRVAMMQTWDTSRTR